MIRGGTTTGGTGRARARSLAVVQARMTSSRLPGKVLEDLGGAPVLQRVIERLSLCAQLAGIVVATSDHASDDPVAELARSLGMVVVRGPLHDVLARYRVALDARPCDAVVRITADCPLIDPSVVDRVVWAWRADEVDYAANIIEPRTFPKGMDVEVVSSPALRAADDEATDAYDREHVTPFVRSRPERFPQSAVTHDPPRADVRLTLDTLDDLALMRELIARVGPDANMEALVAAVDESSSASRP